MNKIKKNYRSEVEEICSIRAFMMCAVRSVGCNSLRKVAQRKVSWTAEETWNVLASTTK